jgi:hypothetical protein
MPSGIGLLAKEQYCRVAGCGIFIAFCLCFIAFRRLGAVRSLPGKRALSHRVPGAPPGCSWTRGGRQSQQSACSTISLVGRISSAPICMAIRRKTVDSLDFSSMRTKRKAVAGGTHSGKSWEGPKRYQEFRSRSWLLGPTRREPSSPTSQRMQPARRPPRKALAPLHATTLRGRPAGWGKRGKRGKTGKNGENGKHVAEKPRKAG